MSPRPIRHVTAKLDKAAVGLSALCLVHCLLLPLAIALFPVLGIAWVDHATFHQIILIFVIPTTAIALGIGYARHRRPSVPLLGLLGVAGLLIAAFVAHAADMDYVERAVTVASGLILAAAHIHNYRLTRSANHSWNCRAAA